MFLYVLVFLYILPQQGVCLFFWVGYFLDGHLGIVRKSRVLGEFLYSGKVFFVFSVACYNDSVVEYYFGTGVIAA